VRNEQMQSLHNVELHNSPRCVSSAWWQSLLVLLS